MKLLSYLHYLLSTEKTLVAGVSDSDGDIKIPCELTLSRA